MHTTHIITRWLLAPALAIPVWSQNISTVAGNSTWGQIYNVTVDAAGNLYAADFTRHVVYKTDRLGATTVVAGTGTRGYSGDGALATGAQLNQPAGTAVAPDGTLYIADFGNDRIRRVAPNGIITTIAGSVQGFTGDGGPATAARINGPLSLVLSPAGDLFFTDSANLRVRRIAANGTISTVAGTGRVSRSGDGGPATAADSAPGWLALGSDGSIYFTDDGDARFFGNKRVRKVAPNRAITTVAGTGVAGFTGDGGPATQAQLRSASGVAVDPTGNVFIADAVNARIRKVGLDGNINTFAGTGVAGAGGDGGPALSAQLNNPFGLAMDPEGNLFVADRNNLKIRKIAPPPVPTISATNAVVPSFLGKAGFGSNMYAEIYGSNLAPVTRTWSGADFNGANAPTSLDGVSVTVNGKPAFVYFISPGQININTPEDTATGPVQIQVRNAIGLSNIGIANRARLSPSLHSVPQFTLDGRPHVVALTPDFRAFVGRPGMVPGVSFVTARPGDSIVIYALGCGPTNPPTQAGVVAGQNSPLALPFEIRIAGVQATVTFGGMAAGTVGLYQFNVTVPDVPAGVHNIELIVDNVPNAQNLVIAIGQ
jgi:uncharacterized protein (TIGR03437 family)